MKDETITVTNLKQTLVEIYPKKDRFLQDTRSIQPIWDKLDISKILVSIDSDQREISIPVENTLLWIFLLVVSTLEIKKQ